MRLTNEIRSESKAGEVPSPLHSRQVEVQQPKNQSLTNVAEIDITVTAESVLSGCTTTATKTETAPLRCSLDNQAGFDFFFSFLISTVFYLCL